MPAPGEAEKAQGNEHFKAGRYAEAVGCYSSAIALSNRSNATFFLNRAQAYLKLNKFEDAERDATSVLELDVKNTKALFRRALAYKGQLRYVEALHDLNKAKKLDASSTEILKELDVVQALLVEQNKADQKKRDKAEAVKKRPAEPVASSSKIPAVDASKLKAALSPESVNSGNDLMKPVSTRKLDKSAPVIAPLKTATSVASKPSSFAAAKEARFSRLQAQIPTKPASASTISPAPTTVVRESECAALAPIITGFDFTRAWREAAFGSPSPLDARRQVLERIDPIKLPEMLGSGLEPDLLSDIINTVHAS